MLDITVVFKNGGTPLEFRASNLSLQTSTEEATYGELVGYKIETSDTYTASLYINPKEVAGILALSDDLVKGPNDEQGE